MAAPKPARFRHVVMGPGLRSNPNMHRAPRWLLESADRSRVRGVVVSKTLRNVTVCESADQLTSGNEVDENRIH